MEARASVCFHPGFRGDDETRLLESVLTVTPPGEQRVCSTDYVIMHHMPGARCQADTSPANPAPWITIRNTIRMHV